MSLYMVNLVLRYVSYFRGFLLKMEKLFYKCLLIHKGGWKWVAQKSNSIVNKFIIFPFCVEFFNDFFQILKYRITLDAMAWVGCWLTTQGQLTQQSDLTHSDNIQRKCSDIAGLKLERPRHHPHLCSFCISLFTYK